MNEFLAKHSAKNIKNQTYTHSRIPNEELNIRGGSYIIPKEELSNFYSLYYDHVFVNKKKEYLTEKQLENGGPIAVDFDFKYNYDVDTRLHTSDHIQDMILIYLEELKEYFTFEENKPFDIFIFEKPHVNRLADGSLTKDGIHMIIGIQMEHIMQLMLREKIIEKMTDTWDLPFINTWDSILDEGISKGKTGWQLYGSRKPGHEAYELSKHFVIKFDKSDGEFMMDEQRIHDFDVKNNFVKLSVQNDSNPKFELNPKIVDIYNKMLENKPIKLKRPNSKTKINLLSENQDESDDYISLNDITDRERLEKAVNNMLKELKSTEYDIKETHEYAQVLPEKYYEPGSHLLNRQLAFALKHTDDRLFLSWVMVRSKASDFDYDTIPKLYRDWKKYFNSSQEGITRRSIMYWAKQDNFEGYERVKQESIEYFIEESIKSNTEYDKALVLRQMYKDKYVCVSLKEKGIWYSFNKHRWVIDKGLSLRASISKQMYELYSRKRDKLENEFLHYEETDPRVDSIRKKMNSLSNLMLTLKATDKKNNIMREAAELFYDDDFVKQIDTNKYLLCFNNGVVDFKNKVFREGYPHDYITKTTRINYLHYDSDNPELQIVKEEILTFMEKLFPIPDLNRYMWDHLSSCLIGSGKNQCFNVYHGSGSNGKSIVADLMSLTLGEYKGTVPITLVTEKRGLIGGTSDEVLKLKGVRYAVMQEPSKNVKLNEGIMKELTGGDPIQARGLYSESEIFQPQFNLVVCTNNLFDVDSNDDGTWRRIKKVDFMSKFIDEGEDYNDDTPYIFPKDKTLKDKLPTFAPIFASMLVKRAFETDGIVVDCQTIINASNKYRKGQDHIAAFVSERIIKTGVKTDKIGKNGINSEFKLWFQQEQGNRKVPKGQELYDYMDKKFGAHTSKGWIGVSLVKPEENENEEMEEVLYSN
jgi:P4 family phage/plasmid primase-like protien